MWQDLQSINYVCNFCRTGSSFQMLLITLVIPFRGSLNCFTANKAICGIRQSSLQVLSLCVVVCVVVCVVCFYYKACPPWRVLSHGKLLAYEPVSGLLWVEKQPFFYVFFVHSVIGESLHCIFKGWLLEANLLPILYIHSPEILQCFILQLLLVVWCLPSTSIRKR